MTKLSRIVDVPSTVAAQTHPRLSVLTQRFMVRSARVKDARTLLKLPDNRHIAGKLSRNRLNIMTVFP